MGVEKTTDGGVTWEHKVQGLTALSCSSLAVSPSDPLRVYAAFYGPLGIYRSLDGTSTWTFLPIPGASQVRRVLVDPFDSQRVYAGADSGFYTSTDGGDNWTSTEGRQLDRHGMEPAPVLPARPSRGHGGRSLPGRPSAGLFRWLACQACCTTAPTPERPGRPST